MAKELPLIMVVSYVQGFYLTVFDGTWVSADSDTALHTYSPSVLHMLQGSCTTTSA